MFWLLCMPFLVVAAFFILFAFLSANRREHLRHEGVVVDGVIEALHTQRRRGGATYLADYSFRPDSLPGVWPGIRHGESALDPRDFDSLKIGSGVGVTYLRTRPDISELTMLINEPSAAPWRGFGEICGIIIGVIGACILAVVGTLEKQYRRELYLIKWGTAAPAEIVGEEEIHGRYARWLRLTYSFRDQSGKLVYGRQDLVALDTETDPSTGRSYNSPLKSNPTALYDPSNVAKSMLLGPKFVEFYEPH
jgi:hypothetical protein